MTEESKGKRGRSEEWEEKVFRSGALDRREGGMKHEGSERKVKKRGAKERGMKGGGGTEVEGGRREL